MTDFYAHLTHLLAEQYAAGRRRMDCPACGGGESRDRLTMTLSHNEVDGLVGFCWRSSCKAFIRCEGVAAREAEAFTPEPLLEPYRLLREGDRWLTKWAQHCDMVGFESEARHVGLRVLVDNSNVAVWKLRALDYTHLGHVTRDFDKTIRTFKELDRPMYYSHGSPGLHATPQALFLFEDPMSAALCRAPAIALLGTSLYQGVIEEMKRAAVGRVCVCLDPGAEADALKVYTKLVAAGIPATYVPMPCDFKDMPKAEREALVGAYS